MTSTSFRRFLIIVATLALPALAYGQEASVSGTVIDSTGGALPGVMVRAVHGESGNSFQSVTDASGTYRLALRVGTYKVTTELSGFAPVARSLVLLIGQDAVLNLQLAVSGLNEAVTVTSEAPLLDTSRSDISGNIDPRQLEALPVNGRNWMDLTLMVPGSRLNAVTEVPNSVGGGEARNQGDFELNVDGQQITWQGSYSVGDGQPHFSKDAIAEFQFISNRFDATQGRSSGVQVNVITKSGTNTPSGSFSGFFRDDKFNAADFVAKKVIPYQDQQLSATFGGPLKKDKIHIFGNVEYERNPTTYSFSTAYPLFNGLITANNVDKKGGLKLNAEVSHNTRLTFSSYWFNLLHPTTRLGGDAVATATPSNSRGNYRNTGQYALTVTEVLSNRALNEIKAGYAHYLQHTTVLASTGYHGTPGLGGPTISFQGLTAGGPSLFPEIQGQDVLSFRDDFTYVTKGGRHTVKTGGEYLYFQVHDDRCSPCEGTLDATGGPVTNAQIQAVFGNGPNEPSTWNLLPLSSITNKWSETFGPSGPEITHTNPRYTMGFWVQDDWAVARKVKLNLGLRYDLELNAFANNTDQGLLTPLLGNRPNQKNEFGPRTGVTISLTDKTVIRGGWGLYFGTVPDDHYTYYYGHTISLSVTNDGRPDFASNPWNGPDPTWSFLLANLCTPTSPNVTTSAATCLRPEAPSTAARIYMSNYRMPYTYQASTGVQHQIGSTMAFTADYVYNGSRNQPYAQPNINLSYDPATGVNYPFSDISKRPFPNWGVISMVSNGQYFNLHSLQASITKRMSGRWQASGTYTLSQLKDAYPQPYSGFSPVPFAVAPDLGGEYSLAVGDQRHRATANAIWEIKYGISLSGTYIFGSGQRLATNWGTVDLRNLGTTSGYDRLRPDGTIVPRNDFVTAPVHKVDLRLQKRFLIRGHATLDGMVELFNAFNHANFGSYTTSEVSPLYGTPSQNTAATYLPRMLQLGFRATF